MNDGEAPRVRLGMLVDGGLAPATPAVVERGVQQRPGLASTFQGEIEFDMDEGDAPVPSPQRARGRAALGMVALGRVRVTGRLSLMRRFLNLIRI